MSRFMLIVLVMILVLPVSGTASAQPVRAKSRRPPAARQAVAQAMRGYATALRRGPADAVIACYTEKGELLLPGMAALRGRAAIRAFLAPLAEATEIDSVDIDTELLETHGRFADQWGTYRQVAGERGKPKQQFKGRYAALWHLEADGQWRLARLMMQPL